MEPHDGKLKYGVVEFEDTSVISAVPLSWVTLTNGECFCSWPKKNFVRAYIMKNEKPDDKWKSYKVKLISKHVELKMTKSLTDSEKELGRGKRTIKRKKITDGTDTSRDDDSSSSESDECKQQPRRKSKKQFDTRVEAVIENFFSSTNKESRFNICDTNTVQVVATGDTTGSVQVNQDVALGLPEIRINENNNNILLAQLPNEIIHESPHVSDVSVSSTVSIFNDQDRAMIRDIQDTVHIILRKLNDIPNSLHQHKYDLGDDKLPSLPLQTIDAMWVFEEELEDKTVYQQFKNKMCLVGGSSIVNNVNRCLKTVFSNELACICSWTGQKGNIKIQNLTIMKIIEDGVRCSYNGLQSHQFQMSVQNWFRFARNRASTQQ